SAAPVAVRPVTRPARETYPRRSVHPSRTSLQPATAMLPLALATCLLALPFAPQGHCFDGTGGPGGNFAWVVRAGEVFFFDTTETLVLGGPGGVPIETQHVI